MCQHEWIRPKEIGRTICAKCDAPALCAKDIILVPMERIVDKESHRRLNPFDYVITYGYRDYMFSAPKEKP